MFLLRVGVLMSKPAALDIFITCVHVHLCLNQVIEVSMTAGSAGLMLSTEGSLPTPLNVHLDLGCKCVPLVVKTFGAWGEHACFTFSLLTTRLASQSHSHQSVVLKTISNYICQTTPN